MAARNCSSDTCTGRSGRGGMKASEGPESRPADLRGSSSTVARRVSSSATASQPSTCERRDIRRLQGRRECPGKSELPKWGRWSCGLRSASTPRKPGFTRKSLRRWMPAEAGRGRVVRNSDFSDRCWGASCCPRSFQCRRWCRSTRRCPRRRCSCRSRSRRRRSHAGTKAGARAGAVRAEAGAVSARSRSRCWGHRCRSRCRSWGRRRRSWSRKRLLLRRRLLQMTGGWCRGICRNAGGAAHPTSAAWRRSSSRPRTEQALRLRRRLQRVFWSMGLVAPQRQQNH